MHSQRARGQTPHSDTVADNFLGISDFYQETIRRYLLEKLLSTLLANNAYSNHLILGNAHNLELG